MKKTILLNIVLAIGLARASVNFRTVSFPGAPPDNSPIYLPLVSKGANIDLTITRLDISQAIQTPQQSVPLVAGRPTRVRVYLQAIAGQPVNNVMLSFSATRAGSPLPGSPITTGPMTAPLAPSQDVYNSTANVSLPPQWLSGSVALTVTADPANAIPEANEGNNALTQSLTFNSVPPLDLKIVPITYTHTPTGKVFPAVSIDPVSYFVMDVYPLSGVSVSYRSPVSFSGNLSDGNEWMRLLNVITSVKTSDGSRSSQVYYGLIPTENPGGDYYDPAWGGMAWIGYRAGIGIDWATQVGAHEIGHMFGRRHAPCGNPSGVDPNYPYANAIIGNYGIDVDNNRLISPTGARDLMSYCSPYWISDYTYLGLYNDQLAHGAASAISASQDVLFVRATFDASGVPALLPVYSLVGTADEAVGDSEVALELYNEAGALLDTIPVRLYEASEPSVNSYGIFATIPRPAQTVAEIHLLRSGEVMARRVLRQELPARATVERLDAPDGTFELRWGRADVPALVRYTTDDGETWTTLGIDVLGGALQVDPVLLEGSSGRFEVIFAD